jgi:hypothetical protein
VVAGGTSSIIEFSDAFVTKLDMNGDTVWYQCLESDYGSAFTSIIETSNHEIVATGWIREEDDGVYYRSLLAKFSGAGELEWISEAEENASISRKIVSEFPNGDFAVLSRGFDTGAQARTPMLIRFDSSGDQLWSRLLPAITNWVDDYPAALISVSPDSLLIVTTGRNYSPLSTSDALLIMVNEEADTLWTRVIETAPREKIRRAVRVPNGGYVLAGDASCALGGPMLMRLDADGELLWTRYYFGETYYGNLGGLTALTNGALLVSGSRGRIGEAFTSYLLKVDSEGNQLWLNEYEDIYGWGEGTFCCDLPDNSYFMLSQYGNGGFAMLKTVPEITNLQTAPIPESIELLTVYPNPFNAVTNIEYFIPGLQEISVIVFNNLGQRVETLYQGITVGQGTTTFNGSSYSSGIYFVRLLAGNNVRTQRVVLTK